MNILKKIFPGRKKKRDRIESLEIEVERLWEALRGSDYDQNILIDALLDYLYLEKYKDEYGKVLIRRRRG